MEHQMEQGITWELAQLHNIFFLQNLQDFRKVLLGCLPISRFEKKGKKVRRKEKKKEREKEKENGTKVIAVWYVLNWARSKDFATRGVVIDFTIPTLSGKGKSEAENGVTRGREGEKGRRKTEERKKGTKKKWTKMMKQKEMER